MYQIIFSTQYAHSFHTFSCLFCALYTLWRIYLNICSTIHFSKYIQWHVCCSRVPFECKWRGKVCHYTYFEKLWVKCEGISISKGKFEALHYKRGGGIAILSCYTYSIMSQNKGLLRNLSLTNITQWLHDIDLLFFTMKLDALQRWMITRFAIVCHGKNEVYRTTMFTKNTIIAFYDSI